MQEKSISFLPNHTYHIYHRGINGEDIFKEERNYQYFLLKFAQYINPIAETYAYCLLKNHFHFLVRFHEIEKLPQHFNTATNVYLSKQFSNLLNGYTQSINKANKRHGKLFSGSLKRKLVSNEQYFLRLLAYIHLNPVNHGFCTTPDDYKYSSFWAYLLPEKKSSINRLQAYSLLKTKEDFLQFHNDILTEGNFEDVLEF